VLLPFATGIDNNKSGANHCSFFFFLCSAYWEDLDVTVKALTYLYAQQEAIAMLLGPVDSPRLALSTALCSRLRVKFSQRSLTGNDGRQRMEKFAGPNITVGT